MSHLPDGTDCDLRPNAGPPNPPLTDDRLRQLAFDPIVASNANEVAMAIELLELRQRAAESGSVAIEPIGYIAGFQFCGEWEVVPPGDRVVPDREAAEEFVRELNAEEGVVRVSPWRVLEVRETQS